ncbi:MAG: hypothetical protein IH804_07045 [Planctomycetes bacterium]|nr:hypothetical protein [Planctomycetota bacterium]
MTPKHTSWLLTAAIIVGTAAAPAGACGLDPGWFARQAVSDDPRAAESAIAALRRLGPAGLDAFVREHADSIASARVSSSSDPRWERISRALDAIGRQHDNHSARLYWFTDLERAKAASGASGKPILSLRLLGRLDEELSCANSRFIRTALYANEAISARLRDQFVLHWSSQRPAPRITIDFGDGRSIVRTITGNSIHYLLDADGRPLRDVDVTLDLTYWDSVQSFSPLPLMSWPTASTDEEGRSRFDDLPPGEIKVIARRLVERGVRYVQVWHGKGQPNVRSGRGLRVSGRFR